MSVVEATCSEDWASDCLVLLSLVEGVVTISVAVGRVVCIDIVRVLVMSLDTRSISATTGVLEAHEVLRVRARLMPGRAHKVFSRGCAVGWQAWVLLVVSSSVWCLILIDRALRHIIIAVDGVLLSVLNLATRLGASLVFCTCRTRLLLGSPVEVARGGCKLLHVYLLLALL